MAATKRSAAQRKTRDLARRIHNAAYHGNMAIDDIVRDLILHAGEGYSAGQIDAGPQVFDYKASYQGIYHCLSQLAQACGAVLSVDHAGVISFTIAPEARSAWPRSPIRFWADAERAAAAAKLADPNLQDNLAGYKAALASFQADPARTRNLLAAGLPPELVDDALAALGIPAAERDRGE